MKKLFVVLLALMFLSNGLFSQTGITQKVENVNLIPVGKAESYYPPVQTGTVFESKDSKSTTLAETEWILLDTIFVETIIPPSGNIGVILNTGTRTLELIYPHILTPEAQNAVLKSPKWLRLQLEYTFSKLSPENQNVFAGIINLASDPYIDEIAFTIAYTSPEFLASDYCFPELYEDNARLVYSHDSDLAYVDIIDYGTSTTDENYYSTVKYWKIDKDSNRVQVEVPRDIYYMYIVHPKITDEYEGYVNPTLFESNENHLTNLEYPPSGFFWRDYMYTHTEKKPGNPEEDFPVLKDEAVKCNVLWDEKNAEPSAVRTVTKWINDVMEFNSGVERPHQPVRIYALHLGRCGEHEDITAAAARSLLIPTRGIEAMSSDHVWNEFWDEQWWQWEPVNNSHKDNFCYEKGWGKKFGSILSHRSDGVVEHVAKTYSEKYCTINVYVRDSHERPIDGALIIIYQKGNLDQTRYYTDSYAYTDKEGKATILVGEGLKYYAKMKSSLGDIPPEDNKVIILNENPVAGQEYSYVLRPSNFQQVKYPSSIQFPDVPSDEYLFKVNYSVPNENINWKVLLNDFPGGFINYEKPGADVNFYIADEYNFNQFKDNQNHSVIEAKYNVSNLNTEYKFRRWWQYYAWLSNNESFNNGVQAQASFSLYVNKLVGVDDGSNAESRQIICYPNPMSSSTTFKFKVPDLSNIRLSILDIHGREVKRLVDGIFQSGIQSIEWDGRDEQGNELTNGMYFYQLDINGRKEVGKVLVVR
ncbi:MAG: T9SS type A sorting domain-containing protein [Bacteroidetes bacterium]|nr:MAG: T9SS type A sorting domain-containing protein [Bacteroidota bacterium]